MKSSLNHSTEASGAGRLANIARELKAHAPFTAFGALTGIAIIVLVILTDVPHDIQHTVFHVLHPVHVVLSAMVTTALYRRYGGGIWAAVGIGFLGSVGICSISDIIFPYLGGELLGATISFHLCFIEHPLLVIPAAFAGVAVGLLRPATYFPHAGHVLVSTWASLFYLTAFGVADWLPLLPLVFIVLFLAVWLPCCVSDIVFPLLFRKWPEDHQHSFPSHSD